MDNISAELTNVVESANNEWMNYCTPENCFFRKFVNFIWKDDDGNYYKHSSFRKEKLFKLMSEIRFKDENGEKLFTDNFIIEVVVKLSDYRIQIEDTSTKNKYFAISLSPSLGKIECLSGIFGEIENGFKEIEINPSKTYLEEIFRFVFSQDRPEDIWIPDSYLKLFMDDENIKNAEDAYMKLNNADEEKSAFEAFMSL